MTKGPFRVGFTKVSHLASNSLSPSSANRDGTFLIFTSSPEFKILKFLIPMSFKIPGAIGTFTELSFPISIYKPLSLS